MQGGYVCDFTDRTFGDFILETTGVDVYEDGYNELGTSKANRLRLFWKKESNYLVSKLLNEMLNYWKFQITSQPELYGADMGRQFNQLLYNECLKIVERLKISTPIENINDLVANTSDKNFVLIIESIKDSISKDKPDLAIDRLHTYTIKYIRGLCDKHEIKYTKETPLHSLFGLYVKNLENRKLIESEMTFRILKSSISLLDSFNNVRNNQSLAHDNQVLNYEESVLIFNNISNSIKFIESVEKKVDLNQDHGKNINDFQILKLEDFPF
jgi:hypothetical protein